MKSPPAGSSLLWIKLLGGVGRNIIDQSLSCRFPSEDSQGSISLSRMNCLPTRCRGRAEGLQPAGQRVLTPWYRNILW
ncbi:hypothetical protein CGRA01v4_06971 [Colletotrichum graminicola]|nr:hypothetical protein CGRA01v4_06971 [Colletotrichum graminicola]